MPDNKEFRFGAYSGLLAVIMVIALAVMAFVALEPAAAQFVNDTPEHAATSPIPDERDQGPLAQNATTLAAWPPASA